MTATITREQATRIASEEIGAAFALLDEHTTERPYGWIFFYDSVAHIRSGEDRDLVAGN